MKAVRLISLISRVFLMITLGLGLFFWIAQIPVLSGLLALLVQIHFTSIHEGFGSIGVLGLLILGVVAVFTKGSRRLGVSSMIYALVVPAFGLSQPLLQVLTGGWFWLIQIAHLLVGVGAMMLALRIGKRYQQLKLKEQGVTAEKPLVIFQPEETL